MNISLLQYPIAWTDKHANLRFFEDRMAALAGKTDVAILPEMFSTGFCTDRPDLAENMQEETVRTLRQWAHDTKIAIIGSFMATDNGRFYNRAFLVEPDGQIHQADKRHLFSLGKENELFTPGTKRLIVTYRNVTFCILVCYDLRFPVWSRNRTGNDYDVLVYVANFPEKRIADWDILLPARAVENQCYVCAVNCVGTDETGTTYNGHSVLLDYRGKAQITFADNETGTKTAAVDVEQLHRARQKFPVWRDADTFELP